MSAGRRDAAETVIARELSRLADANSGVLPRGAATAIYRTLRAEGVGMRKQDALRLIGEYADYLRISGRTVRLNPERYAPAKSASSVAAKRQAALDVVARMRREGLSLPVAVREHNRERPDQTVSADSVKRYAPNAVQKRGRTWAPTAFDRYARSTDAVTTSGVVRVTVRDSRAASLIARHDAAVRAYLRGDRDERVLHPFRGKGFRVNKRFYALETDPERLKRLADGGAYDGMIVGSYQEVA
jgi:hypothetical protein